MRDFAARPVTKEEVLGLLEDIVECLLPVASFAEGADAFDEERVIIESLARVVERDFREEDYHRGEAPDGPAH